MRRLRMGRRMGRDMKAVLVVDMPKSCLECEFCGYISDIKDGFRSCFLNKHCFEERNAEEEYLMCPLRPLPEKQKLTVTGKNQIEKKRIIRSKSLEWIKKGFVNNSEVAFYCGYNACIDEVVGETE